MTKFYFLSLCLVLISYLSPPVQAVVYPGKLIHIVNDPPIGNDQPSITDASNLLFINFHRKVVTNVGEFVSMEMDFSGASENEELDISPFLTGDGAFIDVSTLTVTSCHFSSEKNTVLIAPPGTKCLLVFKMSALPFLTKKYLLTWSGAVISFSMKNNYRTLEQYYLKNDYLREGNSKIFISSQSLPNSRYYSTYELEFTYNFASEPRAFTSDFSIREMTLLFPFLKINVESCFYRNRDDPEPLSFTRNKESHKWGITLQNVSYLPTEDIQNTIVCVLSADQNISTINMYNMNAKLGEEMVDNKNQLFVYFDYMLTPFLGASILPNAMVSHFKENELSIITSRMPIGDVNFSMTFMKALFGVNDFEVSGDCEWDNQDNRNSNILVFKVPVTASEDTNRCTFKLKNDKKFPSFFSMGYTKNHSPITTFFVYDDSSYKKDTKFNIDKMQDGYYLRGYNLNPYYRYCLDVNDVTFDFDLSKYRITYNEGDAEGCRKGSPILTFLTTYMVEYLNLKMTTHYSQNKFFGSAVTILPLRYNVQKVENELINGEMKVLVPGSKLLPIGDEEDITVDNDKFVSFKISNPLNEPFYLSHYQNGKSKFQSCTWKSGSSKDVEIKSFKSLLRDKPIVSIGPISKKNTMNGEIVLQCELDLNVRYMSSYDFKVFLLTEESMNKKSRNFDDPVQYASTTFTVLRRYNPSTGYQEALRIQWNLTEETLKSQITKTIDTVKTIAFKSNTQHKTNLYYLNITKTQSDSNHENLENLISFSNVENNTGASSKKVNIELVFSHNVHLPEIYKILEEARNNSTFDLKPYTFTLTETTFPLYKHCEDKEYVCGSLCVACVDEVSCVSDFDCFSHECQNGKCLTYEDSTKNDNSSTNYQSSIFFIFALSSVAILQLVL